jgi:subtilisin family serine protease
MPLESWSDRVLVALGGGATPAGDTDLLVEVAVSQADHFEPGDRAYTGDRPNWHHSVQAALAQLQADGLAVGLELTPAGEQARESARGRLAAVPRPATPSGQARSPGGQPVLISGVISPPLRAAADAAGATAPAADVDDVPLPVMIELNLAFEGGPRKAFARLAELWRRVTGSEEGLTRLADEYAIGDLSMAQMKRLVSADAAQLTWSHRCSYRIWPDFEVQPLIDASVVTIKADAAQRSFNSVGNGIVWAVIDSGIQEDHPHFEGFGTLTDPAVTGLHRCFTGPGPPSEQGALQDDDGHGTHVAAIIAGGLQQWTEKDGQVVVAESRYNIDNPGDPVRAPRHVEDARLRLAGMAPRAKLVSLKVLGVGGSLRSRVSRVIQALAYVREVNATSDKLPRIHGVNLSIGYDFDPAWFACGKSPLCQEVDKLVRTGVVVVVAAGNSGFGTLNPTLSTVAQFGLGMTINDPGNAERAITVGSTHRDMPHTFGVSYFSSKGPTGDGRRKPDLVAPGERITSAAAGTRRAAVQLGAKEQDAAVYVEESGTSMAAPHVSGAVAAFLSVRREFVGRPEDVKRIFVESATPLGRDTTFQGAGLVDLMRALQHV